LRAYRFDVAPDGALLLPPGSSSADNWGPKGTGGGTSPLRRTL